MKPLDPKSDANVSTPPRLGVGSWTVVILLLSMLAATLVVAYLGWTLASGVDVPASAYVAMEFGVIMSPAVGIGLMALIFYSSRKGYDEPPVLITPQDGADAPRSAAEEAEP